MPALIIFDGHKSHISDLLLSACAAQNIFVALLPPHSSYLLQPLDQGIFRKAKSEYQITKEYPNATKFSDNMQRIFSSLQAAKTTQIIFQSWSHAGIIPIINNGIVTHVQLMKEKVLNDPLLHHVQTAKINQHARGNHAEKIELGLLNEVQIEIHKNGNCPLCGSSYASKHVKVDLAVQVEEI